MRIVTWCPHYVHKSFSKRTKRKRYGYDKSGFVDVCGVRKPKPYWYCHNNNIMTVSIVWRIHCTMAIVRLFRMRPSQQSAYQNSLTIYAPYDYAFVCIVHTYYNTIIFYVLIVYCHATFEWGSAYRCIWFAGNYILYILIFLFASIS